MVLVVFFFVFFSASPPRSPAVGTADLGQNPSAGALLAPPLPFSHVQPPPRSYRFHGPVSQRCGVNHAALGLHGTERVWGFYFFQHLLIISVRKTPRENWLAETLPRSFYFLY